MVLAVRTIDEVVMAALLDRIDSMGSMGSMGSTELEDNTDTFHEQMVHLLLTDDHDEELIRYATDSFEPGKKFCCGGGSSICDEAVPGGGHSGSSMDRGSKTAGQTTSDSGEKLGAIKAKAVLTVPVRIQAAAVVWVLYCSKDDAFVAQVFSELERRRGALMDVLSERLREQVAEQQQQQQEEEAAQEIDLQLHAHLLLLHSLQELHKLPMPAFEAAASPALASMVTAVLSSVLQH
jgi:hypothetical protein